MCCCAKFCVVGASTKHEAHKKKLENERSGVKNECFVFPFFISSLRLSNKHDQLMSQQQSLEGTDREVQRKSHQPVNLNEQALGHSRKENLPFSRNRLEDGQTSDRLVEREGLTWWIHISHRQ